MRRYCVGNELRYLWTLTNGPKVYDRSEMRRRVQAFLKRLRAIVGALPYVYVLEEHKDGAWHAHLIVGRYFAHALVRELWGHGFVFVSKHGKSGGRANQRDRLREVVRRAAGYVAKYVTKAYEAGDGRHGYMGGTAPIVLWDSDEVEGWEGPRCLWGKWP